MAHIIRVETNECVPFHPLYVVWQPQCFVLWRKVPPENQATLRLKPKAVMSGETLLSRDPFGLGASLARITIRPKSPWGTRRRQTNSLIKYSFRRCLVFSLSLFPKFRSFLFPPNDCIFPSFQRRHLMKIDISILSRTREELLVDTETKLLEWESESNMKLGPRSVWIFALVLMKSVRNKGSCFHRVREKSRTNKIGEKPSKKHEKLFRFKWSLDISR